MDSIGEFLLTLAAGAALFILLTWNKVVLDHQYMIVEQVKINSLLDRDHPEKYKIVGDGALNWIDFYTDSVYKPGDTIRLVKK